MNNKGLNKEVKAVENKERKRKSIKEKVNVKRLFVPTQHQKNINISQTCHSNMTLRNLQKDGVEMTNNMIKMVHLDCQKTKTMKISSFLQIILILLP
jgi:hypothetical protein